MGKRTLAKARSNGDNIGLNGSQGLFGFDRVGIMDHELGLIADQMSAGAIKHHQYGPTRAAVERALGSQGQSASHAWRATNEQDLATVTLVCGVFSFECARQRKGIEGLDQRDGLLSGSRVEL